MKLLAGLLLLCPAGSGAALARTHTVYSTQDLRAPAAYQYLVDVAIDGGSVIVLAERSAGGADVLLYTRRASGKWQFRRVLLSQSMSTLVSDRLIAKNGIALLKLNSQVRVFEALGGDWVEAGFDGAQSPPAGGDVAVSGRRLAVGVDGCRDDAQIFEKSSTTGLWTVTGRVTGPAVTCSTNRPAKFDLNENTLMVRRNASEVHVYTRYLQEFDWPHVGEFTLPADAALGFDAVRLQKTVAVAPRGHVFRRRGGLWDSHGRFLPIDTALGTGNSSAAVFRDGVLVAGDSGADQFAYAKPYVYVDNGTSFDHAAILEPPGYVIAFDQSKGTVAAVSEDSGGDWWLSLFELPTPVLPPRAIANDFQAQDVSAWQTSAGSQFVLAQSGSNYSFRQSALSIPAAAVHSNSDWTYYQTIEANITPLGYGGAESGIGLAIRHVDDANYYAVKLRRDGLVQLQRTLDGQTVTLTEARVPLPPDPQRHVRLVHVQSQLQVYLEGTTVLEHIDNSLDHGGVALLTFDARADFDNVYAAPTTIHGLAWKDWAGGEFNPDPVFVGGNWRLDPDPGSRVGIHQTATAGGATGVTGRANDDQSVRSRVRLDTFNPSPQGAWFGVLARYVDARTHYYLTIRSSNVLQIRKQVNGVITVLASVPFAAAPGIFYDLRLDVLGNQLHAYVNDVRLAQAIDSEIPRGTFGIATYRTAATFRNLNVLQP